MTVKESVLRHERLSPLPPRLPPGRLLVAVDRCEASLIAWRQARLLAKPWHAEIKGLYVRSWVPGITEFGGANAEHTARSSLHILDELRRRLERGADVSILPGDPVEGILQWAKTCRLDLIVMGTHARTGLLRALRGSVAEAVVRRSPVPVLIAKNPARPIRTIVAPYDFRPQSRAGLRAAAAYARSLSARLTILHVACPPGVFAEKRWLASLKRMALSELKGLPREQIEARITLGEPLHELIEESRRCDLIVVTARSRGLLQDLVLGTTAERLLRHSLAPVLAVPT